MKKNNLIIFLLLLFTGANAQSISVNDLSCEHKINPVGIETPQPRLSWKLKSAANRVMQQAYQIRVATTPSFSSSNVV